ncbi:MAG: hypothetical protein OMM_05270 [Candidatus Magnetoglobus multicellularis str. Araruama]|uniref:DUF541 domain-containing protein n=1 Tax=Candidatus Magnetoglobus multicellularis str. Araruama TaxID=890399 RepID=A0A1V1NX51_9BACT|nr:MAG: hypothetical protein OMM_05270 [Candidatus Magnetoglobus multicellularis str. Araruama]
MKIHLIRFFCFTVLLCLYFCHITCAEDSSLIQVEVKGSGKTRQQAIKNAKHNAVEQVMGVYIKSDTEISMGLVVKNDVSSRTEGYIENYEIIAEAPDPINVYVVQLSATINKKKIQYDIEKIYQKDPEELVQFVKNKFFSRSLMVYYQVVDDQDIQNNLSMAVKTLINQIQDELVDYGFRIILQTERARIRKQVIEKTIDKLTAIEYAKQEMSDAVITVNYELLQEKTPDEYLQIFGTASLRCFDVSTGELFANVEHSNTTLSEQSLFYVRKTTKDLTKR